MKQNIKRFLKLFGLKIQRISVYRADLNYRATKRGTLELLKRLGFMPKSVIDIGLGEKGTPELYEIFPNAKHILIDPVEEFEDNILQVCKNIKNAEFIRAAASNRSGLAKFAVNKTSLSNSTLERSNINYKEEWKEAVTRNVKVVTLDEICKSKNFTPRPYLIKIDTDGSELEVLEGTVEALRYTDCIIIESNIESSDEHWQKTVFYITQFLKKNNMVLWDIVDFEYKRDILYQVDLVFLNKNIQNQKFIPWLAKDWQW